MEGNPKKWGLTNPISVSIPTDHDNKLNDQLVNFLKAQDNFESPEGSERRIRVLKHLQKVTEEFVKRCAKAKRLPQSTVDSLGGKIFTYGSYTIGVHGPDSDIDTLVVAPKIVTMDQFFEIFPPTFKEMSDPDLLTEFTSVPDAFVPIIKLEYESVSIDLIFASLPSQASIPRDFTMDDLSVLRGLDQVAMRSVNGTRVAKELLELVPQPTAFRHALRAIKVWSKQRAIYGFVFGYPGGIAWCIMVARICQLYPFACGATIIDKFFSLMCQWNWKTSPVMLKEVETSSILHLPVWNPTVNYSDRGHLMPVITPAYPSMCATHSVTHSTLATMNAEFLRAKEIVASIQTGKKSWADLFQRHTFFTQDHKYYLSIVASCTSDKSSQDAFGGLVQSKLRLLAKGIEEGDTGIDKARVYVKGFDRVHRCTGEAELDRVRQGHTAYQISRDEVPQNSVSTSNGTSDETKIVWTTTWYIGLVLSEGATKSLDISYPVEDFRRIVEDTLTFNRETMTIKIVHTRSYDLPGDVFEKSETKPTKATKSGKEKNNAKRKKVNGAKGVSKRQFAETGLEDSGKPGKKRVSEANGIPMSTPA